MARVCQPCQANICSKLRQEKAKLARFEIDAKAAGEVYSDNPEPPPGYRNATDADLARLNLNRSFIDHPIDPATGKPSDFKASVFVNDQTGERLVAFRGSTLSRDDWGTNAQQAMGKETFYYTRAQRIAKLAADSPDGGNLRFTGHSLGGGLASAASRASGMDATTFNAAGLHANTVGDRNPAGEIDAVYVRGEILTTAQMVPGVAKAEATTSWPLDPPFSIGTVLLTRAASAVGGTAGWAAAKVARAGDLHRMVRVTESLERRKEQVGDALKANNC